VPIGTDELDVAEKPGFDKIVCVLVQDTVVPLVADGEELFGLFGDLDHILALGNVVGHQLLAEDMLTGPHGFDRNRGMLVERDGDHNRLNVLVFQELSVIFVDLDFLGRFRAELVDESDTVFVTVTIESPTAVVGPQISDSHDIHESGGVLGDENGTFISRPDESDADRIPLDFVVPEIGSSETGDSHGGTFHKGATADSADGCVVVFLADGFLLGGQVHDSTQYLKIQSLKKKGAKRGSVPGILSVGLASQDKSVNPGIQAEPATGRETGDRQKSQDLDEVFIDNKTVFRTGRFGDAGPGRHGEIKHRDQPRRSEGGEASEESEDQQGSENGQSPHGLYVNLSHFEG